MTMGSTKAIRQVVKKYSGIKKLDDKAMDHFLQVVAPTLPPRMQQMMFDELFFLTTGLPPMYADLEPKTTAKGARKRHMKSVKPRGSGQATQDAFDIQRRAVDVFGTEDKATAWLTRPNRLLKNKTPLSILGTMTGNTRVEQILGRVEHGGHNEPVHARHGGREDHGGPRHGVSPR